MDLKDAHDIFALHDVGPVERLANGKFAASGTFAKQLGLQPGKEVFEAKSGTWLREISAKQGRQAVTTLLRNELSRQGKAFNHFVQNNPDKVFNDLKSMPHRLSLSALEANAAKNKTFGLRKYLEMVVPYVNQHAGGIIGDSIKEEYFRAGRMKWKALNPETIKLEDTLNLVEEFHIQAYLYMVSRTQLNCQMDGSFIHIDGQVGHTELMQFYINK